MPDIPTTTDLHRIRLTAYPPGDGPYECWELTVEATGEVLLAGTQFPVTDQPARDAIRTACATHHSKVEATNGKQS